MLIKTLLTLSLALMFTGCRIRNSESTTTSDNRMVTVIKIQPGQKLIEVGSHPVSGHQYASVWVQTRPALEGEEFGSLLHTEYNAETGSVIRKILLVEQAPEAPAVPSTPEAEPLTITPPTKTLQTPKQAKTLMAFEPEHLP